MDALTDDTARIIWLVLAIVLVASSLSLRRLPWPGVAKMILVWVAIIGLLWLGIRTWTACCAVPG